ncbi:hypothetical protein GJ631_10830 [Natronomonas sp. CBA1123]|uniref:hypothetical protein n=1 Tax=Natronomonas sp. CBA1123 TaxID=2668070 RepID=UPI0012EA0FF7|nr:hypothetical protein [Natronomonas sp. CBA1123]MUV87049.1 hypothetical protein [Natronomonas sp. CBA1123]
MTDTRLSWPRRVVDGTPVVDVLDGRDTHEAIDPSAWLDALQRTAGGVAIYFELVADHEWWLAYDPTPRVFDALEGPYHMWSTYPTGGWDHQRKHAGVVRHNLADIYWKGDPPEKCDIYRSRVVAIEDDPRDFRIPTEPPATKQVFGDILDADWASSDAD